MSTRTAHPGREVEPGARRRTSSTAGAIGRRRPLPSGRAVAGGFLVSAAAVLVLTAWLTATGTHGQRWVVARHDLAPGTRLQSGDLATETISLPRGSTAAHAYHDPTSLSGRILASPLMAGELVQQGALVQAGHQPSLRPVTVSLAGPQAGDLADGARVDVLVTDGTGTRATTSVVLRGAQVIDVGSSGSSLLESSGDEVTLGVRTLAEVEAVVQATHTGAVSVVVGERSDGDGLGPQRTAGRGTGSAHGGAAHGGAAQAGSAPVDSTRTGGAQAGGEPAAAGPPDRSGSA